MGPWPDIARSFQKETLVVLVQLPSLPTFPPGVISWHLLVPSGLINSANRLSDGFSVPQVREHFHKRPLTLLFSLTPLLLGPINHSTSALSPLLSLAPSPRSLQRCQSLSRLGASSCGLPAGHLSLFYMCLHHPKPILSYFARDSAEDFVKSIHFPWNAECSLNQNRKPQEAAEPKKPQSHGLH